MSEAQKRRKAWINLKELRKKHGWRQQEAAEKLGISRPHLSAIENGRKGISIEMMDSIIIIFNVKYEDFYAENSVSAVSGE
jgi:transcriptional regulator with XRE-family HTH domain